MYDTCSTSKIENPNVKATRNIVSISKSLTTVLVISLNIIMKIPKKGNHLKKMLLKIIQKTVLKRIVPELKIF